MKLKKTVFLGLIVLGLIVAILNRISKRWKPEQVTLPAAIQQMQRRPPEFDRTFRQYRDSIQRNARLHSLFDSLMQARPGFADTIRQLEGLYPKEH